MPACYWRAADRPKGDGGNCAYAQNLGTAMLNSNRMLDRFMLRVSYAKAVSGELWSRLVFRLAPDMKTRVPIPFDQTCGFKTYFAFA
jgi:hypothetical protein